MQVVCLSPPDEEEEFPVSLSPGQKLEIQYDFRYTCGSNPGGEADWEYTVALDHSALDGTTDANPADDVCPRDPLGTIVSAGGTFADDGCGVEDEGGNLTAPWTDIQDDRSSTRLLLPGPFVVGHTDLPLVDTSRPTMPNGDFPGSPERSLPTLVWYPAAAGQGGTDADLEPSGAPYPMIVYSHGLMGLRNEASYLTTHLASHGYIVVAPTYPLSNAAAEGGEATIVDTPNEAGDVSFLIDTFLAFSGEAGHRFEGGVDADRMALAGLSGGGLTTIVAGYDANLRDTRVKAAMAMAPAACWFQEGYYADAGVPLLVAHGTSDLIIDIETHGQAAFERANPPKSIARIEGGYHLGFVDVGTIIDDALACLFFPDTSTLVLQVLALVEALGGAENFVNPLTCSSEFCGASNLPHIDGLRQQQIAKQIGAAFFESVLRGDAVAAAYLAEDLDTLNPDVTFQSVP